MPKPPPPLLLLLLLSTTLSATAAQTFREAPQFYNSPDCPSSDGPLLCSRLTVHVAMTLDLPYLRGSMAAILSLLHHSSCPQHLFFHFLTSSPRATTPIPRATTPNPRASYLRAMITHSFPYLNFQLYPFSDVVVAGLISTSLRAALDTPLNYARSYLADLLPPCVPRVVYLDSDVLAVDDIADLFSTPLPAAAVLAAPEHCNANFTAYFTPFFWSTPSLAATFNHRRRRRPCYFNTGVMVIDLRRWRAGGYTRRIERWMQLQKRRRIYDLGSLPPFLLVFAGDIVAVDHRWNQHGLGGDNYRGLCRNLHPGPVSLLHWSGKGKPWARLDANRPCPLDALWAPYDLLQTPFSLDS